MAIRRLHGSSAGFTLADTAVSLAVGTVLVLAISVFLADNHRAFSKVYAGAYSSATEDALAARVIFHRIIRQARSAMGAASVASDGAWVQVQYYSSPEVSSPDRLARFELSGQDLLLRERVLSTGETLSLQTVCGNVATLKFNLVGNAVQMFLTLEDGTSSPTVDACAIMGNP
jgi:hypothetical protein